jgi:hypothetical protein
MSMSIVPSTLKLQDLAVVQNLDVVGAFVTNSYAEAIGDAVQLVLAVAVRRTPTRTGELRKSGVAVVQFRGGRNYAMTVGKGKADGSIEARSTKRLKRVGRYSRVRSHGIKELIGQVYFQKINQFGEDVALWAHEELGAYDPEERIPPIGMSIADSRKLRLNLRARTEGTGPKYLESAYLDHKDIIEGILDRAINWKALEKNLRREGRK